MELHLDHARTAAEVAALMARPGCTRLLIADLPNDEYHKAPGVSRSGILRLLRSPAHFDAAQHPDPNIPAKEPNAAMVYGSLVHCMALQPALAAATYVVGPDVPDRRAKAWKEALAGLNPECELIHPIDHRRAQAQATVIHNIPEVAEHFDSQQCWQECSLFWLHGGAHWLKCRPDSFALIGEPHAPSIQALDLKTCADASHDGFAKSCDNFNYPLQVAMYTYGIEQALQLPVVSFLLVASESEHPHVSAVYELHSDWVVAAARELREALALYARCEVYQQWPGYGRGVRLLHPPRWRAAEIEREALA